MKKIFSILSFALLFYSCTNGQNQISEKSISVSEFIKKINETPNAQIIDVRTPDEFSKGHLLDAVNYNWNGDEFDKQIIMLDKSKPVFIYCLSGGRSSSAASKMRDNGFSKVYQMEGGIMKWRAANLPETTSIANISKGMSLNEFYTLLKSDKLVLVDFYADWCAPCKKMKPYLDEISKEMASTVEVIRINADDNQMLCKELKIDALPVLQVYKYQKLTWSNFGFIEKAEVIKHLKF